MLGSTDKNSAAHASIPQRDAYQVPEVAVLLGGVGERYVWKLIGTGELASFKTGRLRMVARKDLDAFIDKLREDELQAREAAAAS
jgi:excisionase family DNA binding protein